MIDLQIFLGLPADLSLIAHVKSLKEYPNIFPDYLMIEEKGDHFFIGKKIGKLNDREALHNIEANIYSLLAKLDPDYPFKKTPLVLFPFNTP